MDIIRTRRQLIDQVLDNLGVLAAGQTPSDDDVAKIDNLIDTVIADLAARDVAYFDTPGKALAVGGEFDPALFLWLAHVISFHVAPAFGLQGDPSFAAMRMEAEVQLRNIGRPARTRKMLNVDPILNRGAWRYSWGYYFPGGR